MKIIIKLDNVLDTETLRYNVNVALREGYDFNKLYKTGYRAYKKTVKIAVAERIAKMLGITLEELLYKRMDSIVAFRKGDRI